MREGSTKIVANWIFLGVGMLIVQVLLGGITRLTGSGLSITEWKPIMGALPPMNDADWQTAFAKYQQIAQSKYLNPHFTVSDFKFIFFWEWFHRVWARLIGVVFLIPFVWFLVKGYIKTWMVVPLVILFILGALQGAIGWLMVKSGLNDNDLYVSHIRLAAHFISAMILIGYALVFGLKLTVDPVNKVSAPSLKLGAASIMVLLIAQLIYGAFMAGLKAAPVASTWPTINGEWLPANMGADGIFWNDIIYNKITIHFIHRNLAYLVTLLIFVWWLMSRKITYSKPFNRAKNWTMIFVLLQVLLGILSVLNSPKIVLGKFGVFEWLAQLHQLTGMLLFLSLTAVLYIVKVHKIERASFEQGIE